MARVTGMVEPSVTLAQPSSQTINTDYAYNAKGQATREVDPLGVVTAYKYDTYGLLRTKIVDEGGVELLTEYLYDAAGNVTEQISPEGDKSWYYWDKTALLTKAVRVVDNADTSKQYAISLYYDNSKF